MKEQIYSTAGQNKKGFVVFAVMLLCLAISLLTFSMEWGYRWLSQGFVYLFGGAVIWVSVRYFFSAFIYEIACLEGEWLLIVAAKQGKRYTTLCRMPLHQLVKLTPLTAPENIEKNEKRPTFVHRFRQNMFPEAICQCLFDNGEETTMLELEVDMAFWQTLSCFVILNSEETENG